jgi:hypothetical protein
MLIVLMTFGFGMLVGYQQGADSANDILIRWTKTSSKKCLHDIHWNNTRVWITNDVVQWLLVTNTAAGYMTISNGFVIDCDGLQKIPKPQ